MKQLALDMGLASVPSFANFHTGANQAALVHLQHCIEQPARSPVPVCLWGEAGSGKTHLLQAAAQALQLQGAAVGWLDASVIEPLPFNDAWSAIVMDDCHRYSAMQQQAAFNWFVNAVSSPDGRCRCVLAAADRPPADLQLCEDLRTRLGWGHVFELQALTEPERRAVLRREADARGVVFSDEAMDFMLTRFSRDLSSLMLLLDRLDGYALQTRRAVTIPLIKAMLEDE